MKKWGRASLLIVDRMSPRVVKKATSPLKIAHPYPLPAPSPPTLEVGNFPFPLAHFHHSQSLLVVTNGSCPNDVPKLPIFSNLCSMMSCPKFSPFQPLSRPQNPPLPIYIQSKTCFF